MNDIKTIGVYVAHDREIVLSKETSKEDLLWVIENMDKEIRRLRQQQDRGWLEKLREKWA